jgi:hypothetical protein
MNPEANVRGGKVQRAANFKALSFRGALRAEESLRSRVPAAVRFLASPGMTTRGIFSASVLAFAFIVFLSAAFPGVRGSSASPRPASSASPAGAPSVFAPDKGKLRITINSQQIGTEDFEISPSGDLWIERSSMTAHTPSGEIKATGQLRLSADGAPTRYDWSAEAQKKATGTVDFVSGTAKCSADLGAASPMRKDFTFPSPRIAVLDNNLYYQFGVLARLYDWKAGGKQTFPVLIPQDMVPGSITVESLGPQQAGTGKYETLRVSSPDLEIMLYVDASRRLMRLEVPSSNVAIERE